jgi:V/A-type H+-transporting ATPase subunit I
VDEVRLPSAYAGKTLADQLVLLAARSRALPGELAEADAAFEAFAARARPALCETRLQASAARARIRAADECGETRFAFVISGYMPEAEVPTLRAAATAELGDAVAIFSRPAAPGEWPDVPVVLRNRPNVRPFERLLALVPLPRYGTVDPTPSLALFFPLLFGLVLGDLAFGVLGVVTALLVRRFARGQGARDLATIAFWCSLSAALFGVLFGEAFGELGAHVGLRPLLLDRRRGLMGLLALALAVGGAHLVLGMVLGVVAEVRGHHVRGAVGRAARLALLLSVAALIGCLAGVLPRAALVPLLVAAGGALGVALATEGPMAALELVLGLGNVLSYSRLMALGLASVMLAEAANGLATSLDPPVAGLTLAVLLHAVNFSLGLVSPTIAALRLQYVEFFDKFYDPGGAPFRPFASR